MLEQRFFEINKCIYCGGAGETDEHVMPLALEGKMLLKKASCQTCRDMTQRWERNPLYDHMREARACLGLPSRHTHWSKEIFPIEVTFKDGRTEVLQLTKDEAFGLVQFLELELPAFFKPEGYTHGSRVVGVADVRFGKDPIKFMHKHDVQTFHRSVDHKTNSFERMIARIAYCYVIAFWGPDSMDEVSVLPALLDQKDDIGYWVGCDPMGHVIPVIGKKNGGYAIKLGTWRDRNRGHYVLVRVKIFAFSDAPEYIVVVGKIRQGFKISN